MNNPIKISLKTEWPAILMLLITAFSSIYFFLNFPDQVPTHWNFEGVIDGYSNKTFAAFFFPVLNLMMYLFFLFLPTFDPKKDRYEEFSPTYHLFKNIILGLLTIVYFIVGFAGMGYNVPVGTIMPVMIGVLFVLMGNYLGKVKRNWFMGIKTPWSITNEDNWNKTNRLGGKLFVISGFLFMLLVFLPVSWRIAVFIVDIIVLVAVPFGYSAYLYKTQEKEK